MTDSFVTQCPHCQTSFRVSHNQLSVARGVVRCGSCLQVFNAARQLLEQSAAREGNPMPAVPGDRGAARPVAISQRAWAANEVDLERLDLTAPPRIDTLSASRHDADEPAHEDDSMHAAPVIERVPALDEPEAVEQRTEPSVTLLQTPPGSTGSALHADDDEDDDHPPLGAPNVRRERLSALDADDPARAAEPPRPATGKKPRTQRSEPGFAEHTHLHDLHDDPPHLDWVQPRSSWHKRLLWSVLVVAAALALVGQYVTYHFAELARQDQYRPVIQQWCALVGCKVPSKVDISQIKSSNLVVRSHPDFAGALVVDAIIYNRASFSQPFPLLELRFADLNGSLIASRRFKPGEYLSGDLAGKNEMPPQTPIHIALDILDPGAKAVNYSLSFRSPD